MGLFEKKERLYINPDTGKSEWIVEQKGLPRLRKEPSELDKKVKAFQSVERQKKKVATKAKLDNYKKKWGKAQDWVGKNINPDLLSFSGYGETRSSSGHHKKKHHNKDKGKYIIRNGVAYKVAGSGKKHHHKKKHKQSTDDWLSPLGGGWL